MSFIAADWAIKQRLGDHYAKAVLFDLAGHADESGFCACTLETLARDTCMSVRTVRRKLRWLEHVGLVKTERFTSPIRGINVWAFHLQLDINFSVDRQQSHLSRCHR